jgi:adenylate cyclase
VRFADLDARFFQGVIPATLATCSNAQEPNITFASQVLRVDALRLALSCQFFNKTKQNLAENPHATLLLYDPLLFDCYRLSLRYRHSEASGVLFDQMSARIQAIASHTGMQGVFRLLTADVFDVEDCEHLDSFTIPSDPAGLRPVDALADHQNELRALQLVSRCIARSKPVAEVLQEVLAQLSFAAGFTNSMVFTLDETTSDLSLIACHGYDGVQVGAKIHVGEGLIGTVANERKAVRLAAIENDLRYGRAIRRSTRKTVGPSALESEVPLPGLFDALSQMAIPMLVGEKLVGVIAVESPRVLAFDEWDETFLEIVASQVAARLDGARALSAAPPEAQAGAVPEAVQRGAEGVQALRFRFFAADDCVFLGDEYLVRNVPGRILWRLLSAYAETGRADFSNRELRLDPWLKLPPIRDNLESRLTLLRKRLEERCPDLALVSTSRGCFRIECRVPLALEEVAHVPSDLPFGAR